MVSLTAWAAWWRFHSAQEDRWRLKNSPRKSTLASLDLQSMCKDLATPGPWVKGVSKGASWKIKKSESPFCLMETQVLDLNCVSDIFNSESGSSYKKRTQRDQTMTWTGVWKWRAAIEGSLPSQNWISFENLPNGPWQWHPPPCLYIGLYFA